jgi:hypothetical protein
VGAWIGCRRKGIPLPAFGDAVAPGVVLAQAIGRLGNYFNQELYGRETTVPWGMEIFYRRDSSGVVDVHSLDGVSTGQVAAVVHPTFLYELLWNLLVFVFLLWADRKFRLGHGRLFALYVAAYCVGRFAIELMRDDTATHIAGIRINVFTAVFVFIGALVYFLLAPKGREDPATLRGRQPLEAPHVEAPHEESIVSEWAEDLVAAAKGSGIVAAATVAGEHETEDSAAVGDIAFETEAEKTDFIVPVEDADAEVSGDAEVAEEIAGDEVIDAVDDGAVVVYESPESPDKDETETVVVYESEADDDSEADLVVVDDSATEVVEETEAELVVEDAAADEPAADDTQPEQVDEVEAVVVADLKPEPEPAPKPEPVVEAPAEVKADDEAAQPKIARGTLKRLLWGAGSRSGE